MLGRKAPAPSRRGFTLIELMLVVTIIGVLGSIAIPGFKVIAMKAREAEREVHFSKMKRDLVAHWRANGKLPTCTGNWNPQWPLGKPKLFNPRLDDCWKQVPWGIDGQTRFIWYYSAWPVTMGGQTRYQFQIYSLGDLDANGSQSYRYMVCIPGEMKECEGGFTSYEGRSVYVPSGSPDLKELDYHPGWTKYYP